MLNRLTLIVTGLAFFLLLVTLAVQVGIYNGRRMAREENPRHNVCVDGGTGYYIYQDRAHTWQFRDVLC